MQERIEEDYSDLLMEDENTTGSFIEPARKYVAYIEALINELIQNEG